MKWTAYSLLAGAIILTACHHDDKDTTGLAARVGDHRLTIDEVLRNVPSGLSTADSLRFTTEFINNWVEEQAVTAMAEKNIPSTEAIDKMVDDYRRQLIMWEYRRTMAQQHGFQQPSDSAIAQYYNAHSASLKLERPIVKGLYIKIPDNSKELKDIRRLYRSDKIEDLDKLEKLIGGAINYEYFRDKWTDWSSIESRIPAPQLDVNPDAFPANNKFLDVTNDGFVYLLSISETLPAGASMPLDYARSNIIEALKRENAVAYDKTLRKQLLEQALDDGTAQIFVANE